MKQKLLIIQSAILLALLSSQIIFSQEDKPFSLDNSPLPNPTSPIMDYAGVLDSSAKKRLETAVLEFKKDTNPQVELAVAVVKTTGDRPIFDYSLAVARGWGIGSRNDENPGALLFVAIDDRKYYTQVSRDLEDELPDGVVGSLQRRYLVPQFKRGKYSQGIEDTIASYIRTIKRKQRPESSGIDRNQDEVFTGNDDVVDYQPYDESQCSGVFFCLIVVGILLFVIIASSGGGGGGGKRRRKHRSSGDDVAGDIISGILTGIFAGGGSSSSTDWGTGDSSWGSGSSDWGSSGGGGWGGFGGGGDFGGGGAGGGW